MRAIAFAIMFAAATNISKVDFDAMPKDAQSVALFFSVSSFIGFWICILFGI